jgi:hypothetical protein
MRLTLRTLLAYLDDTLEAHQAREIGQKVAESQPARELIDRIRQVMRRRRLSAPPVAGGDPDFDANVVAQYLDSSLSDEEITRIEEKCLADDQHLAEVASCHQILTLVLGEPAHVPPTARERMYDLVRDPSKAARRKAEAVRRKLADNTASPGHEDADEKLLLGLPRGADRGFLSWTPLLACVLLVGALVALWMSMGMGGRELTQLTPKDKDTVQPAANGEGKHAAVDPKPAQPVKENPDRVDPKNDNPPPPVNLPPTTTPTPAPPVVPASKAEPAPAEAFPPPTERPGDKRFEMGRPALVSGYPNLLLQRERNQSTWKRLAPEKSPIFATDQLLMLPGYRGEIRFDSGVQMLMWASLPELGHLAIPVLETEVSINSQRGIDLDLGLERGRVLLSNHKKDGPALIRVRFGEEVWDITLHDSTTEVGLEIMAINVPYTRAPASSEAEMEVALLVFKGEASLIAGGQENLLRQNAIVMWDTSLGKKYGVLPKLPEWYLAKNLPAPASAREVNHALENLSRVSTTKTMDVALGETLHGNDAAAGVLAIRCFAALGEVPALVNALTDDKRSEVRAAAVEGLRNILAFKPGMGSELDRIAKEKNFSAKLVITIHQLLQGFANQQWAEPVVRTTMVEYLLHDKLLIRQLAYSLLLRRFPDGQRIGYDASADLRKRERACEEWKTLVSPPEKK